MLPSFPTAGRREDVPNLRAWFLVLAALSRGGWWEMERGEVVEGFPLPLWHTRRGTHVPVPLLTRVLAVDPFSHPTTPSRE